MLITYPRVRIRRPRRVFPDGYTVSSTRLRRASVNDSRHARRLNSSDRMPTTQTSSMTRRIPDAAGRSHRRTGLDPIQLQPHVPRAVGETDPGRAWGLPLHRGRRGAGRRRAPPLLHSRGSAGHSRGFQHHDPKHVAHPQGTDHADLLQPEAVYQRRRSAGSTRNSRPPTTRSSTSRCVSSWTPSRS